MRLLDSRRLTGASLYFDQPGAVLDVAVSDEDRELLVAVWRRHATSLLEELEWPCVLTVRSFEGGVSLAVGAPMDGLYTAVELNEAAWDASRDWLQGTQRHLLLRAGRQLRGEYREEERPRLQRLLEAAAEKGVEVILDEASVTLGTGRHSETFDLYAVPHPDEIRWRQRRRVPTALVTGTNGKTTTVRLLASIAAAANKVAGVSSTDWLAMGSTLIARDDYAGPGGARQVLRDRRCELAILETARGGLMRRGLALQRADVAAITNIAPDHLGDYGIETVEDLAEVKWSVTRALGATGRLVLNAEDPLLMARAPRFDGSLVLFAVDPTHPRWRAHVNGGGLGFTVHRGQLCRCRGSQRSPVVAVKKIPICYGGVARHNIANALAAAAVADALKIPLTTIAEGLLAFRNEDNPGRANLYRIKGFTVLLDFAHNPAGLAALQPVIRDIPAQRRLLVTGQAGDRSNQDIADFAAAAGDITFDRVLIKRMDGHARGRDVGEVAKLLRQAFLALGYPVRAIGMMNTELDATRAALRWARAGDLVVLLSHEKRDQTRDLLAAMADKSAAQ